MSIGEALAGPTHAHLHRRVHEQRDVDWAELDWNAMGIDWSSAWAAGQHSSTAAPVPTSTAAAVVAPPAPPATTTAAAAPSESSASSKLSSVISDVETLFDNLVGVSNGRTSFGSATSPIGTPGDDYIGNVGLPYGSNIILVDSAANQQFTNTFTNSQSESITINLWQKAGPDGRALSGSALAPTSTTLTFNLAPGESKTVAFQDNTQIGWAQACSSVAESGAFGTTWGEANFVSTGSGYDVSAIMNSAGNNYKMTITSAEAPQCTSDITQNMWLTATDPVGGSDGSCFIAQSTATLNTVMGGYI